LVITSLVIMIFLTHPSDSSSSVHLSFFSTGGGFRRAVDCENMIGVVDLRLTFFNRGGGGFSVSCWDLTLPNREASVSDELLLLLLFDREPSVSEELLPLKKGKGISGISVSELLLLLKSSDSGVVLCRPELFVQERGLAGVGVLLLLLPLLDRKESGMGISVTELLLLLVTLDSGVLVLLRLELFVRQRGLGVSLLLALLDKKEAPRLKKPSSSF
jgi:hypothetical protein